MGVDDQAIAGLWLEVRVVWLPTLLWSAPIRLLSSEPDHSRASQADDTNAWVIGRAVFMGLRILGGMHSNGKAIQVKSDRGRGRDRGS